MKQASALVCTALVCLACQAVAQYATPPTKGKKHRTTTTTTETPGAISNEISGPFPFPENPAPYPGPGPDSGSYSFSAAGSSSSSNLPGSNTVTGGSFWWQGPGSPFKPGAPSDSPSGGCGGPGGCGPPPPPPPPSTGGCGGPAGCTGVGTDPRPSPAEPPSKPIDIAQNPFLSSAILGKPIPQSPQGCQGPGGSCQYPPGPSPTGTGPTQYPNSPTGSGPTQYPGAPSPSPSNYPGQPSGQYPGQPSNRPTQQYPGQQPGKPSGQYPGVPPSTNQYPGQPSGQPPAQYPGQPSNQPSGQYPQQQPTPQYPGQPSGQYPGQQPGKPTDQYPGQPTPQYPGQPPSQQPGQYPGQQPGKPSGQYPGQQQGKPPGQYPGQQPGSPSGQYPGQQPGSPSGQYPGQQPGSPSGQYPGQPTGQYPNQPSGQYPSQLPNQAPPLRPQCSAAGHACVPSSECVGGVISPTGMLHKKGPQVKECIPGLEACCRLPTGNNVVPYNPSAITPRPGYGPGPVTSQRPYTGPLNTTPYPGCAAALKCVAENYCTAEGVMSDYPVTLTREQAENKVPLTDCQDLETGLVGKCCRDPNYKDPWPAGMMMMKNPGDFDDGQYHGEGSGPSASFAPSYNSISSTPQTPAKDHGPKPSDGPGGFNKPFPPPFPGNTPSRPQPNGGYQPGKPKPSINPYQPGQPSRSPFHPGQPSPTGTSFPQGQQKPSTPYQPGQPSPTGSYQPGQPSGTPYQPGQPSPVPNQPGQPFGSPNQPSQPFGSPNQLDQPFGSPNQPSQPSGSPNQPSQHFGTPNQPGQPFESPNQPNQHFGSPNQPDQLPPTSPLYQPGQPTPSTGPYQPDIPNQQSGYNLPTHPGQNQPSGPGPQDQGPAPGSSCGIRRPGPSGDVAGFAEFPWQALIVSAGNRSHLCGASIIAENAVITAAHCLNHLQAGDLLVKAGEWKLMGQNPKPVQVRPTAAVARHPAYDSASNSKDLAILVLAQPFTFDTHVDKICIPPVLGSEYFQKPGQNCLITGWGKNVLQGPVPGSDLHKVDVEVIPAKQCEETLKASQNFGKYFILNEGFSCARPPSPADLCKVDYGSAVACAREDGHYELAGVNRWDIECPPEPLPSVFATSDTQWINTVLATPTPVLQAQEDTYNQSLLKGESVDGVDIDDKPGFSQGYGK